MSYYDILKVTPQSSDEDIKQAYRKLAKRCHPDRNPHNQQLAKQLFAKINEAYAHIQTQEKRETYNQGLGVINDNQKPSFWTQLFKTPGRKG